MDSMQVEGAEVQLPSDPRVKKLSYSSLLTLHRCPREFELYRKGGETIEIEDEVSQKRSVTFAYGHAFGTGVQATMAGMSEDDVLYAMFLAWDFDLFAEDEKKNKSFAGAMQAVAGLAGLRKAGYLEGYVVATFNDRPAIELGFRIDLPNGYYYVGFVDLVIYHPERDRYGVLELKHTGMKYVHEATYKNSGQALGYTIVLDHISPGLTEYDVYYLVHMTLSGTYEKFEFPKSASQKALWIRELLLDIDVAGLYEQVGIYPMRGENCMRYGRPCEYFGLCTMSNSYLTKPYNPEKQRKEPEYDFNLTVEDLIQSQLGGSDA